MNAGRIRLEECEAAYVESSLGRFKEDTLHRLGSAVQEHWTGDGAHGHRGTDFIREAIDGGVHCMHF